MVTALLLITAYLLGCFNTGYYLVRWRCKTDIRTLFSGNTGSRNVGRLLGTKGFLVTLLGDAGKGMLAVWLARYLAVDQTMATLALLAATAGHIWPLQLRCRGGKGFATFAGGLILLQPLLLVIGFALCLMCYPFLHGTTRTGLFVLTLSPLLLGGIAWLGWLIISVSELLLYCLLTGVVLYAHRNNLRKEFFGNVTAR